MINIVNNKDNIPEERVCYVCGGKTTRKNFNGDPLWYKYRDDKNIWDQKSYMCPKCYDMKRRYGTVNIDEIENKKREYSKKKIEKRKCYKCGKDKSNGSWYKYKDEKGVWNGESYLCHTCGVYEDYSKNIKPIADSRTGNLSRYSSQGKGFIGAQIVAKTNGLDDCNIKTDNFCFYVDLSRHSIYGMVEVKTAALNVRDNRWSFSGIKPENSDTVFLVCMDNNEPWENVDRMYIIPSKDITTDSIGVSKGSFRGVWHDKFRVDERPYNVTYHSMKLENCKVLRHDNQ